MHTFSNVDFLCAKLGWTESEVVRVWHRTDNHYGIRVSERSKLLSTGFNAER
jgi:hypothetical protein